jgi:hypothetical protein
MQRSFNHVTVMHRAIVFFIGIGLGLVGCRIQQPASSVHHYHDSTIVREKVVTIPVPGSHVRTGLSRTQYDSLVSALQLLPRNQQVIYRTDPKMHTRLAYALDSLGRLIITCQTLERKHQAIVEERERTIRDLQKQVLVEKESGVQKLIIYGMLAIVVLGALAVLLKRILG